jgi:putative addiction module component (TIGR02574 family)
MSRQRGYVALHHWLLDIETMGTTRFDFSQLTPHECLQLVEELWDSLDQSDIPLTPAQAEEIKQREALHSANPGRGRPWREVLDEIERRRG